MFSSGILPAETPDDVRELRKRVASLEAEIASLRTADDSVRRSEEHRPALPASAPRICPSRPLNATGPMKELVGEKVLIEIAESYLGLLHSSSPLPRPTRAAAPMQRGCSPPAGAACSMQHRAKSSKLTIPSRPRGAEGRKVRGSARTGFLASDRDGRARGCRMRCRTAALRGAGQGRRPRDWQHLISVTATRCKIPYACARSPTATIFLSRCWFMKRRNTPPGRLLSSRRDLPPPQWRPDHRRLFESADPRRRETGARGRRAARYHEPPAIPGRTDRGKS